MFKNLQLFMENKEPDDDLFDRLNVSLPFSVQQSFSTRLLGKACMFVFLA